MSDENTESVEELSTEERLAKAEALTKKLRGELKNVHGEKKELETSAMDKALRDIGLEPDSVKAKALIGVYEGAPDGLAAFAGEHFDLWPRHPWAERIDANQAVIDQTMQLGVTDVPEPSEAEKLAAAEASGNWEEAGRIKTARLLRGTPR